MRRLFLALLLLSACATAPATTPSNSDSRRGPPLCNWQNAPWVQSTELHLPRGGPAFAFAGNAGFTGVIRSDGPERLALEGTLHGQGITVAFEVDPTANPVFHVDQLVRLPGAGVILANGDVAAVAAGSGGLVRIRPPEWVMKQLRPMARPLTAEIACEALDLSLPKRDDSDDPDRAMLARAGLPSDGSELDIPTKLAVTFHESPGGPAAFALEPAEFNIVWKLGEAPGGWVHAGWVHWEGTVLDGWVAPEQAAQLGTNGGGMGGLGLGGVVEPRREPKLLACTTPQPLAVSVGPGAPVLVGQIAAGRTFEVLGGASNGMISVRFPGSWLRPVETAHFLLPARAATCARFTEPHAAPQAP